MAYAMQAAAQSGTGSHGVGDTKCSAGKRLLLVLTGAIFGSVSAKARYRSTTEQRETP